MKRTRKRKSNLLGLAPQLTAKDYEWIKFYRWGWADEESYTFAWREKSDQEVLFLDLEFVIAQSERSRELWVSKGEVPLSKKLYAYAKQQGLSVGSPAKTKQS